MKRHPFDAVSFLVGGVVLAVGALVLTGETARLFTAWLAPSLVILLGVVVLFAGWRSSRPPGGSRSSG